MCIPASSLAFKTISKYYYLINFCLFLVCSIMMGCKLQINDWALVRLSNGRHVQQFFEEEGRKSQERLIRELRLWCRFMYLTLGQCRVMPSLAQLAVLYIGLISNLLKVIVFPLDWEMIPSKVYLSQEIPFSTRELALASCSLLVIYVWYIFYMMVFIYDSFLCPCHLSHDSILTACLIFYFGTLTMSWVLPTCLYYLADSAQSR